MNRGRCVIGGLLAATALVVMPCSHVLAFRLYNPMPEYQNSDVPRIRWWPADPSPPPGNLPRMPIRYYVNPMNSDMGGETVDMVQAAAAAWADLDGSDISFDYRGQLTGDDGRGEVNDDRNTVSFGGDQADFPTGTLGWTRFWFSLDRTVDISGGRSFHVMTEFDIIMNDEDFRIGTPSQVQNDPTLFDGLGVLAHEFGHALGFVHSSDDEQEDNQILREATMFRFQQQGDPSKATPNEDDQDAANFSYTGTPTVSSVNPADGSTDVGTTLTVNGSGFVRESQYYETWFENGFSNGPEVRIDGTLCTDVEVVSTSRITCGAPPMSPGTYNIVVVNPDGRSDEYTYILPAPSDLEVDTGFVTLSESSPAAVVTVSNTGGGTLHWHAASAAPQVSLIPKSGSGDGSVTIQTTDFTAAWETAVTFTNDADPSDIETVIVAVLRRVGLPGDVDGNGSVDAVDIQIVINAALGVTETGHSDIDGDGEVSALDVQLVINAALGLDFM